MKLIVGLGNPGQKYKNNRHNVGFMVVEKLAKLNLPSVVLFKPQKFMNRSGQEVKKLVEKWKGRILPILPDLYVVHDDLDIELGKFKISFGKGPKVHNGLKSIYEQLGTKDFWHVRVGIDNRAPHSRGKAGKDNQSLNGIRHSEIGIRRRINMSGEEYVLQNFRPEEREIIKKVIDKVVEKLRKKYETRQAAEIFI